MPSHPAEQDQTKDRAKSFAQDLHAPSSPSAVGALLEQDPFGGSCPPQSTFPPPFLHPNLMHLLQHQHFLQQQEQLYGRPFLRSQEHDTGLDSRRDHDQTVSKGDSSTTAENDGLSGDRLLFQGGYQPPMDRLPGSPQLGQTALNSMSQHPIPPVFNMPNIHGPPGHGPRLGMAPMHAQYMAMNGMTPPPLLPGYGPYPMHAMQGPPLFQAPFPHQHQQPPQHQLHQHQLFTNQQMLRQHPDHLQQQVHQMHANMHFPPQYISNSRDTGHLLQNESQRSNSVLGSGQVTDAGPHQQDQIKTIESQITQLLFQSDVTASVEGAQDSSVPSQSSRPVSSQCLTVQEIEEAQMKDLQNQVHKVSLTDPTSPQLRTVPAVVEQMNGGGSSLSTEISQREPMGSSAQLASIVDALHQNPSFVSEVSRLAPTIEKAPLSVEDIGFYSEKHDPYRPSTRVFAMITKDAKDLSQKLMPNPDEETRKLALLRRYIDFKFIAEGYNLLW